MVRLDVTGHTGLILEPSQTIFTDKKPIGRIKCVLVHRIQPCNKRYKNWGILRNICKRSKFLGEIFLKKNLKLKLIFENWKILMLLRNFYEGFCFVHECLKPKIFKEKFQIFFYLNFFPKLLLYL